MQKAEALGQGIIFSACECMRTATELREGYVRLAERVEAALRLPELTEHLAALGSRDTFAFEEQRYLRQLRERAEQGDLTIQGNIRGPASIVEPLQLVLESGALRVLVPLANKAQFAGLPKEVVEKLDTVFYRDVDRAVLKMLEM